MDVNWNEVSKRYRDIRNALIEKTSEGTHGTKRGSGHGADDRKNIRRTDKILLRVGFEFLLKGLFIKKDYNIYEFEDTKNKLIRISDIKLPLDITNKTKSFGFLINNLDKVSSNTEKIKKSLKTIKEEGDVAVHGDEIKENEIEYIKNAQKELNKLFD